MRRAVVKQDAELARQGLDEFLRGKEVEVIDETTYWAAGHDLCEVQIEVDGYLPDTKFMNKYLIYTKDLSFPKNEK